MNRTDEETMTVAVGEIEKESDKTVWYITCSDHQKNWNVTCDRYGLNNVCVFNIHWRMVGLLRELVRERRRETEGGRTRNRIPLHISKKNVEDET